MGAVLTTKPKVGGSNYAPRATTRKSAPLRLMVHGLCYVAIDVYR